MTPGPWLSSREAQAYVRNKSLKAWYTWRDRHGIVARANGSVCRADLDKALKITRPTSRGRHEASLANLRVRRAKRNRSNVPVANDCADPGR